MKSEISFEEFSKLDLRVGRIEQVEAPEDLTKLYKLTVNFGPELGSKTNLAGIKKHFSPEELTGRKVVAVVNLAPKRVKDYVSEGMILAADGEAGPALLTVSGEVLEGATIR